MTITSYSNRTSPVAGNGVTAVFSFAFPITAAADLTVMTRAVSDGTESTKVLNTDYTVSAAPWTTGGSITMMAAPTSSVTLVIIRTVPMTQSLALADGGALPAATANGAFDRITMFAQRIYELATRSPILRDSDTMGSGKMDVGTNELIHVTAGTASDSAATVAQVQAIAAAAGSVPTPVLGDVGKPLRPTAAGAFSWGAIASSVISDATAAGIAVLSAATAALQRTALGLGTSAVIDVGTSANKIVQLDGSALLPAVDGSALINLPTVAIAGAGGRLTGTTGVPVQISTLSGQATIYYTPYTHRYIPIYNGSSMSMQDYGGELSNVLTQSSTGKAGPAAATGANNYDLFVWNDAGTYRLTRGPLWTGANTRGTGAGSTELVLVQGIHLNANAITNGPAAQRGTYVGTIRSNGAAIDFSTSIAPGPATITIWNKFNRVMISATAAENTDTWTYTTATWRNANNTNAVIVTFVRGLIEEGFYAEHLGISSNSTANIARYSSIGLNSLTVPATNLVFGTASGTSAINAIVPNHAKLTGLPLLGHNYVAGLEYSVATGTCTWYGDNGAALLQSGLTYQGMF